MRGLEGRVLLRKPAQVFQPSLWFLVSCFLTLRSQYFHSIRGVGLNFKMFSYSLQMSLKPMEIGIPLTLGHSVSSFVHFLHMWAKLPFKEIFPTDMHTEKKPPLHLTEESSRTPPHTGDCQGGRLWGQNWRSSLGTKFQCFPRALSPQAWELLGAD